MHFTQGSLTFPGSGGAEIFSRRVVLFNVGSKRFNQITDIASDDECALIWPVSTKRAMKLVWLRKDECEDRFFCHADSFPRFVKLTNLWKI